MKVSEFFSFLQNNLNIFLNEQQKEAVQAKDRRILLEACPGGGKTTTLVVRIAYLILCNGVSPSDILTLTFSRASAQDMEERFIKLFRSQIQYPVHFSTIHSFCYKFLFYCQKRRVLTVPGLIEKDETLKSRVIKGIYHNINNEYLSDDEAAELSNEIGFVKNKLIDPAEIISAFENFPHIFMKYEEYKKENNLIDFDDMLIMTYEILCKNRDVYDEYKRFGYVHIDEVQDTSLVQHRIIEELSRESNLFMVGDTDQSIYGFRGAEPEYIVDIKKHYTDAKILKLENNYRSSKNLVELSNAFIQQNIYRHEKHMFTENAEGEAPIVFFAKDRDEQTQKVIQLICDNPSRCKTAVLFRNNLSGLPVIYGLIEKGIPFHIRENYMSFFKHYVIADVFAFFQLSTNLKDIDSFLKVYYKMGASISRADAEYLKENANGKKDLINELYIKYRNKKYMLEHLGRIRKALKEISRVDPYNALEIIEKDLNYNNFLKRSTGAMSVFSCLKFFARGTKNLNDLKTKLRSLKNGIDSTFRRLHKADVSLLTMHGSKGLEFDRVILIDLAEGEFPGENCIEELISGNRKTYEEEVRLFYVGVTRARKEVFLLAPVEIGNKVTTPSRFINQYVKYNAENQLGEGQIVYHKKFGEGVVISCNDEIAEVHFKKHGRRKLWLESCIKSGLLRAE